MYSIDTAVWTKQTKHTKTKCQEININLNDNDEV